MGLLENIFDLIEDEYEDEVIYIGEAPTDAPDDICVISRIRGRPPELTLDKIAYRNPSIRILVRDKTYINAEERMQNIIQVLTSSHHIGTDPEIMGIFIESDILSLGLDDKRRASLYINLQVKCENK